MAFASSSSAASVVPLLATFLPLSEKLTQSNHQLWRAQVLSAVRGAWLAEFIAPFAKPPSEFLAPAKGNDSKEPPH
jgi:hypothetical protein